MTVLGRCFCGQAAFSVSAMPLTARICWCRDCQYLGGGTGLASLAFPSAALAVRGALSWFRSTADSGNVMERGFCPACGTPLFSKTDARPHLIFIRAGALDDPELMAPEMTIWTSSAPSWACFAQDLPRIAGQPKPPEVR